jgi:hypothetical protein
MKPFISVENNAPGSGKIREFQGLFRMSVNRSHNKLVVNDVTIRSQGALCQPRDPLVFLMLPEPSEQHVFHQVFLPTSPQSARIVVKYSGNMQRDDDLLHHKVPAPYHKVQRLHPEVHQK